MLSRFLKTSFTNLRSLYKSRMYKERLRIEEKRLESFDRKKKNAFKRSVGMLECHGEMRRVLSHVKSKGLQEDQLGDLMCAPWSLGSTGWIEKAMTLNRQREAMESYRSKARMLPCVLWANELVRGRALEPA